MNGVTLFVAVAVAAALSLMGYGLYHWSGDATSRRQRRAQRARSALERIGAHGDMRETVVTPSTVRRAADGSSASEIGIGRPQVTHGVAAVANQTTIGVEPAEAQPGDRGKPALGHGGEGGDRLDDTGTSCR